MARHHHRSDRGHSSHSEPPRTLEEAFNGFQERNLGITMLFATNDEERAAFEYVLESIPQWPRPWTGRPRDWRELHYLFTKESIRFRGTSSSSSSSSAEAADFEQHYEYLPPAAVASRRPAASGRADRAGGYPSDMSPSQYASEPRNSDAESRALVPYNTYPSRRNAGGSRDDGRTTRNQGGSASGYSHNGHGDSRRQESRNARHPVLQSGDCYFPDNAGYSRADSPERDFLRSPDATEQASASSWESGSSRGPDATNSRVQAWVHDTSIRHRPGCPLADSGVRDAVPFPSSTSRRGYVDASTQTR